MSLPRLLTTLSGAALLAAPVAGSAQSGGFTDPAEIDRAVAAYTGAPIGAPGGARTGVDRRLRLAQCRSSIAMSFYGQNESSVQVTCTDPGGWRIFVPLSRNAPAAAAQVLIGKGDMVSIAVEGRGFSVAQSGEAMEAGSAGDWIRVKPPGASEPIRAQVSRPGRVVIPLH